MNSTQDPGRRSIHLQRHRVQASEESDETHYSFLQGTQFCKFLITILNGAH